jgi:DNA-binding LytR/AlgR family response regulator
MKVLIIEDESIAVQRLREMLRDLDKEIEIVQVLDSVEASVAFLAQSPAVDLILMDIELGDGQSFEIFTKAPVEAPVIFITAYQEHAIRAFKLNSIDYLLKPLNRIDLETALSKYRRMYDRQTLQLQKNIIQFLSGASLADLGRFKSRFLAKTGTRLLSVPVENIAYFYTKDRLQYIKTTNNEDLLFDRPLEEIEAEIDAKDFFRVNRQFIISYNSIEKVHSWFSGRLKVQIKPTPFEEIVISRLKATEFKKWLGE